MAKDLPGGVAVLYRMDLPGHTCPHGLKAKALLEQKGFRVDDRPLTSREAVDAYKAEAGVATTPQAILDGERIGGYSDLQAHFGKAPASEKSYRPVIALFSVAALMSLAVTALAPAGAFMVLERFIAISMVLLGLQKLKDVEAFSTMFLNYDLLARRVVPYSYAYPYLETAAGLSMLAGVGVWLSAPVALVIGGIGAISVFQAVYIERRELACACVGGNTNVPLGPVSLLENVMMVAMAIWMIAALF